MPRVSVSSNDQDLFDAMNHYLAIAIALAILDYGYGQRYWTIKTSAFNLASFIEHLSRKRFHKVRTWIYGAAEENPCEIAPHKASHWWHMYFSLRGIGKIDTHCTWGQDIKLEKSIAADLQAYMKSVDDIRPLVLAKLQSPLVKRKIDHLWKTSSPLAVHIFTLPRLSCKSFALTALHVKGKWAITMGMYNKSPRKTSDQKLYQIGEHIYIDERGIARSFNATVANETSITTAMSVRHPPAIGASLNIDIDIVRKPAMQAIQEICDRNSRYTEDSLSRFNVVILVLPCATAFVLLASFADVGTTSSFIYILFTDIAAMGPLLFKGIDLIHYSKQKQTITRLQASQ